MSELNKKILNILFLSGEEISLSEIVSVLNKTHKAQAELEKKTKKEIENIDIPSNLNVESVMYADKEKIMQALLEIKNEINKMGLELIENNQKYIITTSKEYSYLNIEFTNYINSGDLTPAQLQTVTIISYMSGASAQEISFIRGVQSSLVLRALTTRGLIYKKEEKYYITTDTLKYLGLENVESLENYQNINTNFKDKLSQALNG